jgi:hypothetical protein
MIVWWRSEVGVYFEPYSHTNEQIVRMLKGKMCFAWARRSASVVMAM